MKLGIIVDSASGLTKKEANAKGWGFIPLLFTIDGKEFHDGIDIESEGFYKQIDIKQEVRTSATPPAYIVEEYERMTKVYDHVVVYGLSKELSSQTNNLKVFAKDFENIHVIDSCGVGFKIVDDCIAMEKAAKEGKTIDEIIAIGNKLSETQWGIALPATMKWLVKGGRISPAVAQLANLFRVVPMISYEKGKLGKFGKGKVFLNTVEIATKAVLDKCGNENPFYIYHGANKEIDKVAEMVEKIIGKKPIVVFCPPVIAIHIGPGVVAVFSGLQK